MKSILYFVIAGFVRESAKLAAKVIAEKTGARVVFRNASSGLSGGQPEACQGVAGHVPPEYAHLPTFCDKGNLTNAGAKAAAPVADERKLNSIGLPDGEGCPTDREGVKAALEAEGIEFHGNAKLEKLVDLYLAHFYPQEENGQD